MSIFKKKGKGNRREIKFRAQTELIMKRRDTAICEKVRKG